MSSRQKATGSNYPQAYPQAGDDQPSLKIVYDALWAAGSKWESGSDWQCVAHEDNRASLGVDPGDEYPVVLNCQAGCTVDEVRQALGLSWSVLMQNRRRKGAVGRNGNGTHAPDARLKANQHESRSKSPGKTQPESNLCNRTLQDHVKNDKPTGPPRIWSYRDDEYRLAVKVRRRDYACLVHPKAIDQLKVNGVAAKDAPYELYRLKEVKVAAAGNRRILLVAGEPSVDAALEAGWEKPQRGQAGFTVTTMRGGEGPGKWKEHYGATLQGVKSVLIVADRDLTGYKHALAVVANLNAQSPRVPSRVVFSKTMGAHDDLVQHLEAGGSVADLVPVKLAELKTMILDSEQESAQGTGAGQQNFWPGPGSPRNVAQKFLDEFEELKHWRGDFYVYAGSHWRPLPTEEVERALEHALSTATTLNTKEEPIRWPLSHGRVRDIMHFVERLAYASKNSEPPFSLDGSLVVLGAMPMANGVLSLGLGGPDERALTAHTSSLFNITALPFPYRRRVANPERWLMFLKSLWGADTDSVKLLQEVMGYLVSGRTDFQKITLIIGPPRSGKGTIAQVCQALLGSQNVAWPTLDSLATQFGIAPLVGRTAAIVGDARFGGKNSQVVIERLLSISGEDSQTVDRKGREAWTGRIGARFLIMSNESPNLRENSGALANRMLQLRLTRSFLGAEDHSLAADLLEPESLAGVFNWALDGLDRLVEFGRFTLPATSAQAEKEMIRLASPITAFVQDECILEPNAVAKKDAMYAAWVRYAERDKLYVTSAPIFGRDLIGAFPDKIKATHSRTVSRDGRRDPVKGNRREPIYRGVRLRKRSDD